MIGFLIACLPPDKRSSVSAGRQKGCSQISFIPFRLAWPFFADDDVVVHGNAQRCCDVDDRLGHLDVGLRGCRVAGRMVVHQDYGGVWLPIFHPSAYSLE
jgi:hypothetical protein